MRGRKLLSLVLTAAMLLAMLAMPALAEDTAAKEMKLMDYQGSVTVKTSTGKEYDPKGQPRLYNGYVVSTGEASYAWISLDDANGVKLDASSSVEVRRKGGELEILLRSGSLFFNVPNSLPEDQKASITTSNTTTGIRGTAGWVTSVRRGHSQVHLLTGVVECTVTDQTSGQAQQTTLTAGDGADFYSYVDPSASGEGQSGSGDSQGIVDAENRVGIQRSTMANQDDLPGYVQTEVAEDGALREKTEQQSGMDLSGLDRGSADDRLKQDEDDAHAKQEELLQELANAGIGGSSAQAGSTISRDLLFQGSENSSSPSPVTEYPAEVPYIPPLPVRYTVTWDILGSLETESYAFRETPSHADPAVQGKVFKGWSPAIAPVYGNTTYTAVFEDEVPVTPAVEYEIQAGAAENGAIRILNSDGQTVEKAAAGSTVTVVLVPEDGFVPYSADAFLLDENLDQISDGSMGMTQLTDTPNTYTFTMPESNVGILVLFSRPDALLVYADTDYQDNVLWAVEGTEDLFAKPGETVLVTVLPVEGKVLTALSVTWNGGTMTLEPLVNEDGEAAASFTMPQADRAGAGILPVFGDPAEPEAELYDIVLTVDTEDTVASAYCTVNGTQALRAREGDTVIVYAEADPTCSVGGSYGLSETQAESVSFTQGSDGVWIWSFTMTAAKTYVWVYASASQQEEDAFTITDGVSGSTASLFLLNGEKLEEIGEEQTFAPGTEVTLRILYGSEAALQSVKANGSDVADLTYGQDGNTLSCTFTLTLEENVTVTAEFDAAPAEEETYTVTFENEDGTVLQSTQLASGEMPSYSGETPTKAADAQYTYTFSGWDKEIVSVTEDAVYTAVYTSAAQSYALTGWSWTGSDEAGYTSATATYTAGVGGFTKPVTVTPTVSTTAPTCTETGKTTYTAAVTAADSPDGQAAAETKEVTIPAGHDWGDPVYVWAADNSTVTATRTCANDSTHVETETADASGEVTTAATGEAPGVLTYTASFTNTVFAAQTKEVSLFTITSDPQMFGGSLSAQVDGTAATAAPEGSTVTIVIEPDAANGFTLAPGTIKYCYTLDGAPIEAPAPSVGPTEFTMPAANVVLKASFYRTDVTTYSITASIADSSLGTITWYESVTHDTKAAEGETVCFTVTPAENYGVLDSIQVQSSVDTAEVEITSSISDDGSLNGSFVMPASDVAIIAPAGTFVRLYSITVAAAAIPDGSDFTISATYGGSSVTKSATEGELFFSGTPGSGYTFNGVTVDVEVQTQEKERIPAGTLIISDPVDTAPPFLMPETDITVTPVFSNLRVEWNYSTPGKVTVADTPVNGIDVGDNVYMYNVPWSETVTVIPPDDLTIESITVTSEESDTGETITDSSFTMPETATGLTVSVDYSAMP